MTEQKAIILMHNEITCINRADKCDRDCAKCDLLRDAEELLKAYNMAISALEKQIAKKPRLSHLSTRRKRLYICPNCSNQCLSKEANERQDNRYCWDCGQRIDWSEI